MMINIKLVKFDVKIMKIFQVQPASGVPGDCFLLGKAAVIEEEPEIPEIDDGGKFSWKNI